MKLKKLLALLMSVLMMLSLLTACGASASKDAMTQEAAPMEAPLKGMNNATADMMFSTGSGGNAASAPAGQKLIRKVNIDAETEDLETLLGSLTAQINALEGYIEKQELYNGSSYSSNRHRSANLTIRIPADKLDSFVGEIKETSNVVSYNESQDDVTLTYVSTESRIKALETEQERLLELLSKADNMSDLLEIEARLTDVRYELESVTSQLLVLANKVDYATVHLYISQVKVYTEVEEQTVWQRIASGFKQNLEDIKVGAEDFFVWLVTYSPQLIVLAAAASVAVRLLRRRNRKRREQMKKIFPNQDSEESK